MDENRSKKIAISIPEDEMTEESLMENIVILKEYPRVTQRHLVINRLEQQNAIWHDLLGNRAKISCSVTDRETSIEAALFWISCFFQFLALVLSYSKETMSSKAVLKTTMAEILFGLAGILTACYKQWRSWTCKSDLQDSENYLGEGEGRVALTSLHVSGFIIASNLAGCIMLLCGFTLLFFFDREGHEFLKSMMYFTGLTIFALAVVDNVVMNKLVEGRAVMKQDQMRLLLHEIKEELFEELQLENKYERVKTLRDYIQRFELFRLQPRSYIYPV